MAEKRKSARKSVIAVAVLVCIVAAAVCSKMHHAVPVQTSVARKGRIRAYVEERGRTSLPHVYHLTMPQNGRIYPVTLKAGTAVKKDQVVAMQDAEDLQDALKESKDMVFAMANAVKAAEARIKASEARKGYAEWLWQAEKTLYEDNKTSAMREKEAHKTFIETKVDHEESQAIFYALGALNAATRLMPIYVNRRLKRTTMRSPVDGVVLKRYVWNEQILQAGAPILDIGDLRELQVTADILSEEVVDVKRHNPVEVYGEAVGEKPVRGTVERIKPQGFTKISSLGVEQQRVPVIIAFNKEDITAMAAAGRKLGLEYRVRVRIYTAERENAVIVPRTALFRGSDGRWETYAIRDGKTELVELEIGLTNAHEAEIISGLSAGDTVVVAPESSLTSGARVKI